MKKYLIRVLIIALMFLIGCKENNLDSGELYLTDKKEIESVIDVDETIIEELYNDETHKTIEFGEMAFDIESYHIVSQLKTDENGTFTCSVDANKKLPQSDIFIVISKNKIDMLNNKEDIVTYLTGLVNDYNKIKIYNNIKDKSGITHLYSIESGDELYYLVYYDKNSYLIQSDYSRLMYFLFEDFQEVTYEMNRRYLESENTGEIIIQNIVSTIDETVEYNITESKKNNQYFAFLRLVEDPKYEFQLKNKEDEVLLSFFIDVLNMTETIDFSDVNLDGYIDIIVLESNGALNNRYAIYVWDENLDGFVKVKCDEMLSYFEVEDGYIRNWQKADATSGVIQILKWDGNSLLLDSEEEYGSD